MYTLNLLNHSGRGPNSSTLASFQSSFLLNIFRLNNDTPADEGLAFLIALAYQALVGSEGQFFGLTNASLNGNTSNQFIAIELDFDINNNYINLDINGVEYVAAYNLS
ncbi:hypothetical protein AAC387_Pa01g0778 [Persea americana]